MYYVYVLQSIEFNRFYIGVTGNVETRLKKHNNGSSKSTKPSRPWLMIYSEVYREKDIAYKREWYLKHPKGLLEKQEIIKNHRIN